MSQKLVATYPTSEISSQLEVPQHVFDNILLLVRVGYFGRKWNQFNVSKYIRDIYFIRGTSTFAVMAAPIVRLAFSIFLHLEPL